MFKDHMHDEYFHANYFGTLFKILWPQLSKEEKEIMGFILCESMVVFAEPRVGIYFYSLSKLGFTEDFISKCIKDIYDTYDWKVNKAKKRMLQTLKLLNTCGVFKIPLVNKEFANRGFI